MRLHEALSPDEWTAAEMVVASVLDEVPEPLAQAALFGSKARGQARPDSDVDILLVFRDLPPDREPHATHAEDIAADIASLTGVPVAVWSVSLGDLPVGRRTPMLVDALEDAIPIWCWPAPLPRVKFTPADALCCGGALLQRIREGSFEFRGRLESGDPEGAARRGRDDLVRLCTALLLLRGTTRPRRADVVDECLRLLLVPPPISRTLLELADWARGSYGPHGHDDDSPVRPPPVSAPDFCATMDELVRHVREEADRLQEALATRRPVGPAPLSRPSFPHFRNRS